MNEAYEKLGRFIEILQATRKIRLAKSDFRYYSESVPEALMEEIHNFKIARSILEYYRKIDFVDIQWYASEDAPIEYEDKELDQVCGSLNIPPFADFVTGLKNNQGQSELDPYKTLSNADYDSLKQYIPFDLLNGNGAVCFKNVNGEIKDELHLIAIGNESFIRPLQSTVDDYINTGIENYFFNNWQQAVFLNSKKDKAKMDYYLRQFTV